MAVINTAVARSRDVEDAALNLNAKAFEVRRTLAAVWDLKPTAAKPPPASAVTSLNMTNESHESVVGEGDERIKVEDVHFAPGGKYRCKKALVTTKFLILTWISNRQAHHPLRIPETRPLVYGHWVAYIAGCVRNCWTL